MPLENASKLILVGPGSACVSTPTITCAAPSLPDERRGGAETLRGETGGVERREMSAAGVDDVSTHVHTHTNCSRYHGGKGGCGLPDPKEAVVEEGEMEYVIGGPGPSAPEMARQ